MDVLEERIDIESYFCDLPTKSQEKIDILWTLFELLDLDELVKIESEIDDELDRKRYLAKQKKLINFDKISSTRSLPKVVTLDEIVSEGEVMLVAEAEKPNVNVNQQLNAELSKASKTTKSSSDSESISNTENLREMIITEESNSFSSGTLAGMDALMCQTTPGWQKWIEPCLHIVEEMMFQEKASYLREPPANCLPCVKDMLKKANEEYLLHLDTLQFLLVHNKYESFDEFVDDLYVLLHNAAIQEKNRIDRKIHEEIKTWFEAALSIISGQPVQLRYKVLE